MAIVADDSSAGAVPQRQPPQEDVVPIPEVIGARVTLGWPGVPRGPKRLPDPVTVHIAAHDHPRYAAASAITTRA